MTNETHPAPAVIAPPTQLPEAAQPFSEKWGGIHHAPVVAPLVPPLSPVQDDLAPGSPSPPSEEWIWNALRTANINGQKSFNFWRLVSVKTGKSTNMSFHQLEADWEAAIASLNESN